MNVTQISSWKSTQIASMTNLINTSITNYTPPLDAWTSHNSDAITGVTTLINELSFTRNLSSAIIKQQLLTVYTYISIKYLTVMDNPATEALFGIPALISGTTEYPAEDDFRNLFVDAKPLPDLDFSYFNFVITPPDLLLGGSETYSVSASPLLTTLKTNLSTTWSGDEITFWNGLPDRVNGTTGKILYMMFNKPKMKLPDPNAPLDPKLILLDSMHFREAISSSPFKADFLDVFPELV